MNQSPAATSALQNNVNNEASYKTVMCKNWLLTATCKYGLNCRFAHGEGEKRDAPLNLNPKYKTRPCAKFLLEGICPYGERCLFIHPYDREDHCYRAFGPKAAAFHASYSIPPYPCFDMLEEHMDYHHLRPFAASMPADRNIHHHFGSCMKKTHWEEPQNSVFSQNHGYAESEQRLWEKEPPIGEGNGATAQNQKTIPATPSSASICKIVLSVVENVLNSSNASVYSNSSIGSLCPRIA